MSTNNTLERAKKFIYENGRLLDRRRFEYHFEGGSSESVITALRSYQNADGGFGNALEPDIRCPQSQTVPTEMALAIMDEVNAFDSQILEGIESYLGEVTLEQGGVPLVLRSVNDYPHAPWWTTEADHLPSVNPTGGIVGLLYKQKVRTEILDNVDFAKNVNYMWQEIENGKPSGFHDGIHWITFLQHTPERERANTYWPSINEWLRSSGTIELDPQAAGYVHKVLDCKHLRGRRDRVMIAILY